jgi:acetylornithine/succinyldiaminopimelate/putrescine aminotransferase
MWDIDGNKYIDYVGSWGLAIIGHADDEVLFFLKYWRIEIAKTRLLLSLVFDLSW